MPTLREFAGQQNSLQPTQSQAAGSLSNFAQQQPLVTQPKTYKPEIERERRMNAFRYIGKQLKKPIGVAASEARGIGDFIGSMLSIASPRVSVKEGFKKAAQSFSQSQADVWNVITGKKTTSFSKELEQAAEESGRKQNFVDKAMGIGSDIVLDPLWVIKPIQVAKGIGEATKLAKPAKTVADLVKKAPPAQKLKTLFTNTTGDKAFDAVVTKFRTLKDFREANLIDDAVKLQKDIKQLGKTGIKNAEELITKGLEKPGSLVETARVTAPKFVTKDIGAKTITNNKYVEAVRNQLEAYRRTSGSLVEQQEMFDLSAKLLSEPTEGLLKNAEDVIQRFGVVETPVAGEKIISIVDDLSKKYKTLLDESRRVGLSVGEIKNYAPHIRTKESFLNTLKSQFKVDAREFGKGSVEKGRKLKGTIDELVEQGIDIFEKNPAIQLVKKGQTYAKAITSQEFAQAVKPFASKAGVKVTHPALKGLKFAPEQAAVIDNFYQGIKPEELKVIIKGFDKVQNWWKAQALISPSYHIRNVAGNLWNNFLAGVTPDKYFKAGMIQKAGIKNPKLVEEMRKLGVINEGWYAKDIADEVVNRVSKAGNWKAGVNPISQQNYAFQLNKKTGSVIENNARIAHYLAMKDKGMTAEKAAQSVKKFLFDYGDLTSFEKNVMKRVIPFYTWTRKNIPIQLEGLATQPAKYALPHKLIEFIESGVGKPDEKYMGPYITENIPVRLRKNKEGNTEYFLLGNWLPYASAIDILSQPLQNVISMSTPLVKTPYELASNKSTFFKSTLGEPSPIERRYKQQGEFIGQSMRKKNILLLRNIRILNDINKWVDKQDPQATQNSWMVKALNTLFGKTATYDVGKSKFFYDLDTDERVSELEKAIKDAQKRGFKEKADDLRQELIEFKQIRDGQ